MRRVFKRLIKWICEVDENNKLIASKDRDDYYRHGHYGKEFRLIEAVNGHVIEFASYPQDKSNHMTGGIVPQYMYVVSPEQNIADVLTTILVARKLQK